MSIATLLPAQSTQGASTLCKHCGLPCPAHVNLIDGEAFCCNGCAAVYQLLQEADLCQYYSDAEVRPLKPHEDLHRLARFDYLADEALVKEITHFYLPDRASVTVQIPAMHCSACLYVLEHLHRLNPALLQAQVDFVRKELTLDWNPQQASLKELVLLLAHIGYEPLLPNQKDTSALTHKSYMQGLVMRLGVVGFCAGNLMLFSFPEYLGIPDTGEFTPVFTLLKVLLALPVILYGASPYWQGAWHSFLTKQINIDVPLTLGIGVLFVRSILDILLGHGEGYLDSLSGLVLFLLVGRWVQARSFDHLRFDQTLDSYFPLAAKVVEGAKSYFQKADTLEKGQIIEVQSEMLFPADGILLAKEALVDYSFATGESKPALVKQGEHVFAGGRLKGPSVTMTVEKSMSRSRFTRLWSDSSFQNKPITTWVSRVEVLFSAYFTIIVIAIAACTALYWAIVNPSLIWNTVTAVLLVACPCALSLAMPFASHSAMQFLATRGIFLRHAETLQELAGLQAIAFDKTGTLTESKTLVPEWIGAPLREQEKYVLGWMVRQSAHPLSQALALHLPQVLPDAIPHGFEEVGGQGLQAIWHGQTFRIGKQSFVTPQSLSKTPAATQVVVSINDTYVGIFRFHQQLRQGVGEMLERLANQGFTLAMLSGDAPSEAALLKPYLCGADIIMQATPLQKLEYIKSLTEKGLRTAMVGDGMNDAGAFAAAHVGIAVREQVHHFSPTCDVILDAGRVSDVAKLLSYSKRVMQGVGMGFLLSLVFNAISLSLAISGNLNPMIAAALMPISSLCVVLFSIGWARAARSLIS